MRRILYLLSLILLGTGYAEAQSGYTSVAAVVADSANVKYVNAPFNVSFYDPGTSGKLPLLNGSTFQQSFTGINTDSFGNLAVVLPDNGVIAATSGATGTQWIFSINDQTGKCHAQVYITITGISQNISAALTAALPVLSTCQTGGGGGGGGGSPPVGNVGDLQLKANTTTFGPAHINDNLVNLSFTESIAPLASVNISLKPFANASVQWASFSGSDANDGYSPGSAKLSIYAALETLPGGAQSPPTAGRGTVYVLSGNQGTSCALLNPYTNPAIGLGFMYSGDANYASPPNGWMHMAGFGNFAIIGVTQDANGSLSTGGGKACTAVLGTVPTNMLALNLGGMDIENLTFPPSAQPVLMGYTSTGVNNGGFTGSHLDNDTITTTVSGSNGPTIKAGQGVFQIYMDRDTLATDCNQTPGTDGGANILIRSGVGNIASFAFYITNNWWYCGGGVKYDSTSSFSTITIHGLDIEAFGTNQNPGVWFVANGGAPCLACTIEGIQLQDYTTTVAAVRNDNSSGQGITTIGVHGNNQDTVGPMTFIGDTYVTLSQTVSPLQQGQIGFVGGRVEGQIDNTRRLSTLGAIRYVNLANPIPTTDSGTGTVTTGIADKDGGSNAVTLTATSGVYNAKFYRNNSYVASVGDTFIAGVWVKSITANGYDGSIPAQLGIAGAITVAGKVYGKVPWIGDGDWEWVWVQATVTVGGTGTVLFDGTVAASPNTATNYYGPVFIIIPAGSASVNETYEIANSLQSYANTCAVSNWCGMGTKYQLPSILTGAIQDTGLATLSTVCTDASSNLTTTSCPASVAPLPPVAGVYVTGLLSGVLQTAQIGECPGGSSNAVNYPFASSDRGCIVTRSAASNMADTLAAAGSGGPAPAGFTGNWYTSVANATSTFTETITIASGTLVCIPTSACSGLVLTIPASQVATVWSPDNVNWSAVISGGAGGATSLSTLNGGTAPVSNNYTWPSSDNLTVAGLFNVTGTLQIPSTVSSLCSGSPSAASTIALYGDNKGNLCSSYGGAGGNPVPVATGIAWVSGDALQINASGGSYQLVDTNTQFSNIALITASNSWSAGVTQTFAPNATHAGVNIGSVSADPASPNNGDEWYNTTSNTFKCRQGGTTLACVSSSTSTPATPNGSLQYNSSGVFGAVTLGPGLSITSGTLSLSATGFTLSSQFVNSQATTFANLGSTIAVAANTNYQVSCSFVWQSASASNGIQIQWTGPSGATSIVYTMDAFITPGGVNRPVATHGAYSVALTPTYGSVTTSTDFPLFITLGLQNGATPGNLQLQAMSTSTTQVTVQQGGGCIVAQTN